MKPTTMFLTLGFLFYWTTLAYGLDPRYNVSIAQAKSIHPLTPRIEAIIKWAQLQQEFYQAKETSYNGYIYYRVFVLRSPYHTPAPPEPHRPVFIEDPWLSQGEQEWLQRNIRGEFQRFVITSEDKEVKFRIRQLIISMRYIGYHYKHYPKIDLFRDQYPDETKDQYNLQFGLVYQFPILDNITNNWWVRALDVKLDQLREYASELHFTGFPNATVIKMAKEAYIKNTEETLIGRWLAQGTNRLKPTYWWQLLSIEFYLEHRCRGDIHEDLAYAFIDRWRKDSKSKLILGWFFEYQVFIARKTWEQENRGQTLNLDLYPDLANTTTWTDLPPCCRWSEECSPGTQKAICPEHTDKPVDCSKYLEWLPYRSPLRNFVVLRANQTKDGEED